MMTVEDSARYLTLCTQQAETWLSMTKDVDIWYNVIDHILRDSHERFEWAYAHLNRAIEKRDNTYNKFREELNAIEAKYKDNSIITNGANKDGQDNEEPDTSSPS